MRPLVKPFAKKQPNKKLDLRHTCNMTMPPMIFKRKLWSVDESSFLSLPQVCAKAPNAGVAGGCAHTVLESFDKDTDSLS